MRALSLMLSPAQLRALDKRLDGRMMTEEEERMVTDLGGRGQRAWDLLEAVLCNRIPIARLYDAYRSNQLARLRAELDDVDLAAYLARWQDWLTGRVAPDTATRYRVHLATLHHDQPWPRSMLTAAAVDRWLSGLPGSSGTKRKYFAALASFLGYLDVVGIDHGDPLRRLTPPPAAPPRIVFLELDAVRRVVDAVEEPYRTLFALLYGTGIDLSTALGLTRRSVFPTTHEIHAHGTKSEFRHRVCLVAEWAWPFVAARIRDLLPDGRLFSGVSRWTASDVHRAALERLRLRGEGRNALRLHDARHHWAVRAVRAGTPIELVARQLGHADGTLALRVYGRFVPTTTDRQHWEREASKKEGTLTTELTTGGERRRDAAR